MFWMAFVPIYNRYGTKRASLVRGQDFKRVDTKASITPHKAMKTKGTEYEWKWIEIFSVLKIPKYRPAINIEHWSERLGVFAIIGLGESVNMKFYFWKSLLLLKDLF